MGVDPESHYPLKGLAALKSGDEPGLVALLESVAKKVPTNVAVHFALGKLHFDANRWVPAAASLRTYVERSSKPGPAAFYLGKALAAQGKTKDAVDVWEKALASAPDDAYSAFEIDKVLLERFKESALQDLKAAKECVEAYDALAAKTKGNPFVFNSAGFLLREAYTRHKGDGSWLPILKASVRFYEAGAKIIDEMPEDVVGEAKWGDRYGWAQITSDTGLMFQFYPEVADAKKAETYYLRALKLTNTGYYDAWNNLRKLYREQKEFQKVYDLDAAAAEGLALEDGKPHTAGRDQARQEMAELVAQGKAKAE